MNWRAVTCVFHAANGSAAMCHCVDGVSFYVAFCAMLTVTGNDATHKPLWRRWTCVIPVIDLPVKWNEIVRLRAFTEMNLSCFIFPCLAIFGVDSRTLSDSHGKLARNSIFDDWLKIESESRTSWLAFRSQYPADADASTIGFKGGRRQSFTEIKQTLMLFLIMNAFFLPT